MRKRTRPGFVVANKIDSDDCQPRGISQKDIAIVGRVFPGAGIDASAMVEVERFRSPTHSRRAEKSTSENALYYTIFRV